MFNYATLKKDKDHLRKSGYFDAKWCGRQCADVAMTGIDPLSIFCGTGHLCAAI
ncbi:MAG: hypothetical protein ACI9TA_001993 [Reinekea sp.]|jgi:hypothetical protein